MGPRVHRDELIDAPDQDFAELEASLRQVAQVNRFLGGSRAIRRHLLPHLARLGGRGYPVAILDVGTGNGDVAARLATWVRGRGMDCRVTALDCHDEVIRVAAKEARDRPGVVALVQGDALELPFADAAFDFTVCTLTLHHFENLDAVRLVSEMGRVARSGVVVNDLERTAPNYWTARLFSQTWWRRNRLTRHDGPVSVLRSFTRRELQEIGRKAGLIEVDVRRRFPFHLVLEGRRVHDLTEARATSLDRIGLERA